MDIQKFFAKNRLRNDLPIINNFGIELGLSLVSIRNEEVSVVSATFPQKIWRSFKSGVRFVVTTILIFGVIQIGINFPAYKQKYDFFREKQLSIKDPNKEILKSLQRPTTSESLSAIQVAEAASQSVEDSFINHKEVINFNNFEIAPTDNRIVIGKIGKNVPIMELSDDKLKNGDYDGLEKDIQSSLLKGIVHYPGTVEPGQIGNAFFTGHSSNYVWVNSKYNDVLALLEELVVGDKVTLYWKGKKYVYQAYDIKVVNPKDTWVLQQSGNEYPSIMTLMTCTPVGTSLKRLVVRFKQLYPNPTLNTVPTGNDAIIKTGAQTLISN
ncbi:MAG: hypothetical protein A2V81_01845 [Candidatus Abawacabacteria bacterium RBG_16_42_10]|uniref:Sortase n=1 Tax=Candidatus Abawacabacteria bacterium RBG_16_42_10 TaxID=1817814 RepID=A0A1F4XKW0_9BACT|nr:MAG: hypothetical protein A2V81_01845 [Candidatus Abawacabacteria bacterium RBG_16_42_10]